MRKVKVGWKEYTIEEVDSHRINEGDGEYKGRALHGPQIIRLNRDYPKDAKDETLIHEILHAIDVYAGLDLREEQIVGMSNMIFQVLKDNHLMEIL